MSDSPAPEEPPDLLHQLSVSTYRVVVHQLYKELPPPGSDDPEETALLIDAAIATIASMCPANADEATIATRVVSADAQASDCIRQARDLFNDPTAGMKCHGQASLYMRTANAARSLLLRVQTARRKREAIQAASDQDAWTEHCAANLMAAARRGAPVPQPEPPPADDDDDKFAKCDEAEQYALLYPNRAAEIRADGGVPPTARYGPPDPRLMLLIISSTSPILQQLDHELN